MPEVKEPRIFESKGLKFLLKIEDSDNPEDYRKYENLREEIWAFLMIIWPERGSSVRNFCMRVALYSLGRIERSRWLAGLRMNSI